MKCPIDETVLQMSDRQGIEIDYCPQCRGVWLDRGELDKLIDKSIGAPAAAPAPPPQSYDQRGSQSYPQQRHDDSRRDSGYYKKRKKESFLGELFDF
jgi:Zn-finger nucleic acid-binding protein